MPKFMEELIKVPAIQIKAKDKLRPLRWGLEALQEHSQGRSTIPALQRGST